MHTRCAESTNITDSGTSEVTPTQTKAFWRRRINHTCSPGRSQPDQLWPVPRVSPRSP